MALVTKNFSDIITFTRASTGTFFNSAGVLTSAAINDPRFDYNPSTLAAQGLLIEESRTNSIRNNTMVGAVAGTPGTLPTTWQLLAPLGVTRRITLPIVSGVQCIDINFSGTTTSNDPIEITPDGLATVASNGQSWSGSAWVQIVQDDAAITSTSYETWLFDSVNAFLSTGAANNFYSTRTSFTRRIISQTLANASVAGIKSYFKTNTIPSGSVLNFTLRIGLPQLELGAFATSVIPTTTTALTRAADVASVNTLSPWFNATEGTLYGEFAVTGYRSSGAFPSTAALSDSTGNNLIALNSTNVGANLYPYGEVVASGTPQAGFYAASGSGFGIGTVRKSAIAYATNDFAFTTQGLSVQTDPSGTVPTINRLYMGVGANGTTLFLNGYLRRISYYPRKLSSAELQAITA